MGRILLALLTAALLLPATATAQPCPVPLPIPQCQEPEPEPTPEPPPDQPPSQPQAPPPQPVSNVEGTATTGVDAAHTGYFADPKLAPPLKRRWRRRSTEGWDLPLYGQGRIFVSSAGALRAIDPRNGRDLWKVASRGSAGAYDDGRIFVLDGEDLRAHSADDGRVLWTVTVGAPPFYSFSPVATGGTVYTSTTDAVVAVDAATGAIRWRSGQTGVSMPAVDESRVYTFSTCGSAHAWNRVDGSALWASPGGCQTSGGTVPVVYRGRVYATGAGSEHDAASGERFRTYQGGTTLFAGDVGVFEADSSLKTLEGVDLDDGRQLWKVKLGGPSDALTRAAVISGSTVYALNDAGIYGIDLRTGARLWTMKLPAEAAGERYRQLSAAPGLLISTSGTRLTAWENVFDPLPDEIQIGPRFGSAFSGGKALVGGIVGTDLRAAGRVRLEVDPAPFGGWRRDIRGTIQPDGWVGFKIAVGRNIRVRVVAGGRRSNVSTLYAYPRVRFKFARAGGTGVRTTATLRYARRGKGLGGRRAFLYLGRTGRKRYQRMGATTVRATGRTGARAVFVHAAPANIQPNDTVAVCVRGQARAGLGAHVGLIRRCGRRSVRF